VGGRDQLTGEYHGIHWHVSRNVRVEYRAGDAMRNEIRDVRVIAADGKNTLFTNADQPELPVDTEWRAMDCVDCHNRPTHVFFSAERNVDTMLLRREVDTSLPELKAAGLAAVTADYPSQQAASDGIKKSLLDFYRTKHPDVLAQKQPAIEAAAKVLFDQVYVVNVYPELNIKWGTYASRVGHNDSPGCFRCHDGNHKTAEGKDISQDCELCHAVIVDGDRMSAIEDSVKQYIH